jgi:hypothetical protein
MDYSTLTLEQINRMPSDDYAQHFNNAEFRARVDFLESQPKQAPQPRQNDKAPAPAQDFSGDPSWSDTDEVAAAKAKLAPAPKADAAPAQPAAPAATEQPAAEPKPLSIWRYQPTDSQGRKIGGEQVFRYDPTLPVDDPKSLASQLTKAHKSATIALRSKKLEQTIASISVSETPFEEPKLLDDSVPNAKAINDLTEQALGNAVSSALTVFQTRHPDYKPNNESAAALIQMVQKSRKNPADPNVWAECWATLKPLLEVPVAASVPAPAPAVETKAAAAAPAPAAAAQSEPVQPAIGVATGLSNVDTFNHEMPQIVPTTVAGVKLVIDGKAQVMDLKSWDRLPSDTQKRALRNPANARAVDALYERQQEAQAARRAQGRR